MALCRKQVLDTKSEAEKDGVCVPLTLEDYCVSSKPLVESQTSVDFDYYDDYPADADDSDSETVAGCSSADVRKGESRHGSAGL